MSESESTVVLAAFPWRAEPDSADWESSGYQCFIRRGGLHSWCGYVAVPADHPWNGLDRDHRVTPIHYRLDPMAGPMDVFVEMLDRAKAWQESMKLLPISLALHAHGSVTWSGPVSGLGSSTRPDWIPIEHLTNEWCFGFDCNHYLDVFPEIYEEYARRRDARGLDALFSNSVYRNQDYVMGVASRLAAQLRIVQERGYP